MSLFSSLSGLATSAAAQQIGATIAIAAATSGGATKALHTAQHAGETFFGQNPDLVPVANALAGFAEALIAKAGFPQAAPLLDQLVHAVVPLPPSATTPAQPAG